MTSHLPVWVQEAARWPLAFAQVREDPRLDLAVLERVGPGAHIIMVASGGCTAALLAARANVSLIHLVDPNSAQLALARLKLHFLRYADSAERLALLGHASWHRPGPDRADYLAEGLRQLDLPVDILGDSHWVGAVGPDYAGRYERVFAELRACMQPVRAELDAILALSEPAEQARRAAPDAPLGQALDAALDEVMALPNLVALFGPRATHNRALPFARHFACRTRHALSTLPAATNPFLWQMYRGNYPPEAPADWFLAEPPASWPEIAWSNTMMTEALAKRHATYDLVHLSNILDWLPSSEAQATLDLAAAALKPGGHVFIRQLNSTLDVPGLVSAFAWQHEDAQRLHQADRSFFYRRLHLGRKR